MNRWTRRRKRLEDKGERGVTVYQEVGLPLPLWQAINKNLRPRTSAQWLRATVLEAAETADRYLPGHRPHGDCTREKTHRARIAMSRTEVQLLRKKFGNFAAFAAWAAERRAMKNGWITEDKSCQQADQ